MTQSICLQDEQDEQARQQVPQVAMTARSVRMQHTARNGYILGHATFRSPCSILRLCPSVVAETCTSPGDMHGSHLLP